MWSVSDCTQYHSTFYHNHIHSYITLVCLFLPPGQYELLAEMLNKHKLPQEEVEGVIQQYNNVSTHKQLTHNLTARPANLTVLTQQH